MNMVMAVWDEAVLILGMIQVGFLILRAVFQHLMQKLL
jgi:hypothetical protein